MKKSNIEELIKLIKDTSITELSWSEGESKISLKQALAGRQEEITSSIPVHPMPAAAEVPAQAGPVVPPPVSNLHEIKSPMVGTFYEAANPDESPFVKVGDKVNKGQVLCIIEAMKLMNEIESDKDGIIQEVCLENEAPVEYDTVLFRVG